jgi:formate dehydrogenase maturation protein FdhE
LANLRTSERLTALSKLILQRKDLKKTLELHMKILQLQQETEQANTKKGRGICDLSKLSRLQEESLKAKTSINHLVDPAAFDYDILLPLAKKIAKAFAEKNIDRQGFKNLINQIEKGQANLPELVEATLSGNEDLLRKRAEELNIQPVHFLYALASLVQPCFEEITRKIDASFLDMWWQTSCPVCGRNPIVARFRSRKRYLTCTFCGAEYLSDQFVCVHCGSKDPNSLKYMATQKQPAFEINFCKKCRHYIKVIHEARLKEPILKGLEDVATLDLDLAAKKAGLSRD